MLVLGQSMAAQNPTLQIDLNMPDVLIVGVAYRAEVSVRSATPVANAYVKLSLPYALKVLQGQTIYRGPLSSENPFYLRINFQVLGAPVSPIAAKVLVYGESRRASFGKAQILYPRIAEGQIVLTRNRPEFEDDLQIEKGLAKESIGSEDRERLRGQQVRRLEERVVAREPSAAVRFEGALEGVQVIQEDATVDGESQGRPIVYGFLGHRGDRIWVTAESDDFDPSLLLLRHDRGIIAEDDDALGATNARIPANGVFELGADGRYLIIVSAKGESGPGRFRLKLENFTHQGPPEGAVFVQSPPDTKAPSQAAIVDVTLSGTIVYNSLVGVSPVRLALVRLFSYGIFVDTLLSEAQTDLDGNVTLRVPQANVNDVLFFRAYTRDAAGRVAAVQDPLLGLDLIHSAKRPNFSLPNSATVTFGIWNVAGVGLNGPFLLFDAAVEGYMISTSVLAFTPPAVKVTYPIREFFSLFPNPTDPDAHYQNQEISLAAGYETSPDVVLHEYGHFLSHVAGFLGPAGGPHPVPFTQRVNPVLAWNEGWATFFSVAGQNARGRPWKTSMISNHPVNLQNYDLESGHNPSIIRDAVAGDDNEGSVQFVLWDLYDVAQDFLPVANATDSVSLALKTIFDVARLGAFLFRPDGSAGLFAVHYLEVFYDGLLQESPPPVLPTAIHSLFADQGMRWEVPPNPPSSLRFTSSGATLRLEWQPGSTNTRGYAVEQRLPTETAFRVVGAVTSPGYPLGAVVAGTTFRVSAFSINAARFSAPLVSGLSQELTYTGSTPIAPIISLTRTQLEFVYSVGGAMPSQQTITVLNAGGGTLSWTASSNSAWLAITPVTGSAPAIVTIAVFPGSLAVGAFSGAVTFSSPGILSQTLSVTLRVTPSVGGVVNGASFTASLAAGGIFSIFGNGLGTFQAFATTLPLPQSLGGTSVTANGVPCPLFYVSVRQINAQMPVEVQPGRVTLVVRLNDLSQSFVTDVLPVAPGIFTLDGRRGVVLNQDWSVNSPQKPATRSSVIVTYATGQGSVSPVVPTGSAARSDPLSLPTSTVTATLGGMPARVLFAGLAPGFVGLLQVNIEIPTTASPGDAQLVLNIAGLSSNAVTLSVQ
jgi:uncharacterized protein (TIGR03437 family)